MGNGITIFVYYFFISQQTPRKIIAINRTIQHKNVIRRMQSEGVLAYGSLAFDFKSDFNRVNILPMVNILLHQGGHDSFGVEGLEVRVRLASTDEHDWLARHVRH